MNAGDILAAFLGSDHFGDDFVEMHRCRVAHQRVFRAAATISSGTSEPAYRQTGQRSISLRPRTVMRSGAPGPAPMK